MVNVECNSAKVQNTNTSTCICSHSSQLESHLNLQYKNIYAILKERQNREVGINAYIYIYIIIIIIIIINRIIFSLISGMWVFYYYYYYYFIVFYNSLF